MSFLHAVKAARTRKKSIAPQTALDKSTLLTLLNELLGPVTRPDRPSKLDQRAHAAGLMDTINHWRASPHGALATRAEIRQLFTRAELMEFSEHSGLSGLALLSVFCELLPDCVRIRADNNPFFLLLTDISHTPHSSAQG